MKSGSIPLFSHGTRPAADLGGTSSAPSFARRIHILGQLAGIVTLIGLWPQVDAPWLLLVWWVGTSAAQFLLAGLASRTPLTRPGTPIHDPLLRHYLFSAVSVIGGVAWGCLTLIGPYEAGPQAQAFLFMALGGVTLAGAGILFGSRSACAVFVTAVQLPLFIQTVVNPPATLPHASVFVGVFVLFALSLNDLLALLHRGAVFVEVAASERSDVQQILLDNTDEALVLAHGHHIQHWNRRFSELMQVTDTQLPIRHLDACLANRTEWRRHARAAIDALGRGEPYRSVTRLRRADGSEFWAELSGRRVEGSSTPTQIVWAASEISDRIEAETRAALAHDQLFALVGQSADWYWQTDNQHRLMQVTPLSGSDKDGLERHIGRKWWQFPVGGQGPRPAHGALRRTFELREAFRDLEVEVPDGSHAPRRLQLSGTQRFDGHGSFLGYHGIASDVTERIRAQEHIRFLAYHDPLTGLPNRRLLMDRLEQSIARALRYQARIGIILVDVDDFKRINDLAGHGTGDRILVEVADRLRHGVRACDTVARLEGDAFAILLPELESAGAAEPVAAKILSLLHQPLAQPSPRSALGASLGIATFPDDAENGDGLLRIADARMLRAKRRGGQRIERASPALARDHA